MYMTKLLGEPGNDAITEQYLSYMVASYRIARNFRGLTFSQIALRQTFRDLIFEDGVCTYGLPRPRVIFEGKIFEV